MRRGPAAFPGRLPFRICHLRLLAIRAEEPDDARAWHLRDTSRCTLRARTAVWTASADLIVAAALARAKLADSARHVTNSCAVPQNRPNPRLAEEEAYVYTLLGDHQAAFKALKTYWTANPDQQKAMADNPGWKFDALVSDPEWRKVVGAP